MKKIIFFFTLIISCQQSFCTVRVPKIFGNNMVLQRDRLIPVWGWADAGENVSVEFNKQKKNIVADKAGKWMIKLANEKAGGPYSLTIKGKNTITFTNVLVGEVWVCSGQSNMEMEIEGWGKINNYQQEIADAKFPAIRQIKIPNAVSSTPNDDISSGEWKMCTPETAGNFTAAGYFFARELYKALKVPVGLINTTWGGTMVETWTSRKAFEQSDEFKNMIKQMPTFNLDSLSKIYQQNMMKKMEAFGGVLKDKNEAAAWKQPGIDLSKWMTMALPGLWEQRGLNGMDGTVWFRKEFEVSSANTGKPATIELAMIDDKDSTYINGVLVGATNSPHTKRKYSIPAGVLKEGKNLIAVRVNDLGGAGGIYGDAADMKITIGDDATSLAGDWLYRIENVKVNISVGPNDYPTLLFNAMVNPLIPYAMRGVIWYQGEANAGRAYQYRKAFPLMITDWRNHWNEGNFPFYFVQLATFNAQNGNSQTGSTWAELREAQALTLSLPNTGMAITTDIGDANDIHPKNKQDVGKRLAAIALEKTYGKKQISSGPVYQSMQVVGKNVVLSFVNTGSGLVAKGNNKMLSGFEIGGNDQKFYPAKAIIKGNTVIVQSNEVATPKAVRYGWADNAGEDNLYNKEGFPAPPFRTDKWKGITENVKYEIAK